jgi:hypothetical protein
LIFAGAADGVRTDMYLNERLHVSGFSEDFHFHFLMLRVVLGKTG